MDNTNTYAPQSPDLSGFFSAPPKSQQPYNPSSHQNPYTSSNAFSSYAPRSPTIPDFSNAAQNLSGGFDGVNEFGGGYANANYMPPIPALPETHTFGELGRESFGDSQSFGQGIETPYFEPPHQPQPDIYSQNTQSAYVPEAAPTYLNNLPAPLTKDTKPPTMSVPPQYKSPNPNNIQINTKFPVARIKRIMQADEEVGKVAQVTPVAVSKALELFMIALVGGAAELAREKGGKKVGAQHLKQVVEGNPEQFDFLGEIVGRVADVQEGAGGENKRKPKAKEEGSSEEEEEKKPVKKRGGRKKKGDE